MWKLSNICWKLKVLQCFNLAYNVPLFPCWRHIVVVDGKIIHLPNSFFSDYIASLIAQLEDGRGFMCLICHKVASQKVGRKSYNIYWSVFVSQTWRNILNVCIRKMNPNIAHFVVKSSRIRTPFKITLVYIIEESHFFLNLFSIYLLQLATMVARVLANLYKTRH